MSRTTLPVHIAPHLVPFFFEEFEGIEALYLNKHVKAAKISVKKPLGQFLRLLIEQSPTPVKPEKFHMYLSIQDRETSKEFFGQVYKYQSGKNSFLRLPEAGVKLINDHLEGIFRVSMINYISGHIADNDKGEVRHAIDMFLQKYDLYEYGFENESMRKYYYRTIADGYFLKKLQIEGKVKHKKKTRIGDPYKSNIFPAGQLKLF